MLFQSFGDNCPCSCSPATSLLFQHQSTTKRNLGNAVMQKYQWNQRIVHNKQKSRARANDNVVAPVVKRRLCSGRRTMPFKCQFIS